MAVLYRFYCKLFKSPDFDAFISDVIIKFIRTLSSKLFKSNYFLIHQFNSLQPVTNLSSASISAGPVLSWRLIMK